MWTQHCLGKKIGKKNCFGEVRSYILTTLTQITKNSRLPGVRWKRFCRIHCYDFKLRIRPALQSFLQPEPRSCPVCGYCNHMRLRGSTRADLCMIDGHSQTSKPFFFLSIWGWIKDVPLLFISSMKVQPAVRCVTSCCHGSALTRHLSFTVKWCDHPEKMLEPCLASNTEEEIVFPPSAPSPFMCISWYNILMMD